MFVRLWWVLRRTNGPAFPRVASKGNGAIPRIREPSLLALPVGFNDGTQDGNRCLHGVQASDGTRTELARNPSVLLLDLPVDGGMICRSWLRVLVPYRHDYNTKI